MMDIRCIPHRVVHVHLPAMNVPLHGLTSRGWHWAPHHCRRSLSSPPSPTTWYGHALGAACARVCASNPKRVHMPGGGGVAQWPMGHGPPMMSCGVSPHSKFKPRFEDMLGIHKPQRKLWILNEVWTPDPGPWNEVWTPDPGPWNEVWTPGPWTLE